MAKRSALGPFLGVVCALAVTVRAAGAVRVCRSAGADVLADNTGVTPVSQAFQKCVSDPSVTLIDLPPGNYLVDTPIRINNRSDLTIRTYGLSANTKNCQQLPAGACARFVASADAAACINDPMHKCGGVDVQGGMVQANNVKRVKFEHLIFDGNRANRQGSQVKLLCAGGTNRYGFNSRMVCEAATQADHCEYVYNYTENALCGTGLEFGGKYGRIQGNAAFNNGVHLHGLWADGLTISHDDGGIISDNHLYNNTDVGLIVGSAATTADGVAAKIQSNWIEQNNMFAFAGLMLGNFCEAGGATFQKGDYTGASIRLNTINCHAFWCGFGINLGADPWIADTKECTNVFGGTITQNSINGARVLLNFGGAGTRVAKVTAQQNTLTNPPTMAMSVAGPNTTSACQAVKNVLMNLPNNNPPIANDDPCGNFAVVDAIPASAECFKNCFAGQ
jgi:hypothetical protein